MATSDQAPDDRDLADLMALAAGGDPVHQNNLAIIALRSPRGVDDVDVDALLRAAAAKGNAAARYNLALRLPNKFRTDPKIVARRIALLEPNAQAGDPHSQVLLAKTLRFTNRDTLMPDRESRRVSLLKQAAATGDRDYMLLYANALYSRYRHTDRAQDWYQAADQHLAVYRDGDGRGAAHLGTMLRQSPPPVRDVDTALPSRDPVYWYNLAARSGLGTARCSHGLAVFRPVIAMLEQGATTAAQSRVSRHFDQIEPKARAQAFEDLTACAAMRKRSAPPFYDATRKAAFGTPSVFRRKQSAGWTSLSNQPYTAAFTLGVMYAHGSAIPHDAAQAKTYLEFAAHQGKIASAQTALDDLTKNQPAILE